MFDYDKFIAGVRSCETYPDHDLHARFRAIVAAVPAGFRVLDIACGAGTLMAALREKGCHCVGVDLAPGAVRLARSKGLDVVQADIETFEHEPETRRILLDEYDVVIFSKCLAYLHVRNALMRQLRTGHILINQSNPYYWRFWISGFHGAGVGQYLSADGREIHIGSPAAMMEWGASYGYRARRLKGGWLRGRDMVLALSKPERAAELRR